MEGYVSAEGLLERSAKFFKKNHWPKREGHLSNVHLRMLIKQELEEQERKEHPKKKEQGESKSRQALRGIYDRDLQMLELCEGSIGALTFLKELEILERPIIDHYLRAIDDMGIYEEDLYTLWNSCCQRTAQDAGKIIRLYMNKTVTAEEVHEWILNRNVLDPDLIQKQKKMEEMKNG